MLCVLYCLDALERGNVAAADKEAAKRNLSRALALYVLYVFL